MAIAASLWFDSPLEATIRAAWSEIARREISKLLHESRYRPHLTLGVWEPLDHDALARQISTSLRGAPSFEIVLGAIGGFTGEHGVVFLQPGTTPELVRLREHVHEAAARLGARSVSWYPQGPWFPHVTIAWRLSREAQLQAIECLQGLELPLRGLGVAVGIVDTPAEVELHRIELASPTRSMNPE
jgi:2'-5' RNA ligase